MVITLLTLAVSMILNAMYFIPSAIAIWSPVDKNANRPKPSKAMQGAIGVFVALNIVLGVYYDPIIDMIEMGIGLLG